MAWRLAAATALWALALALAPAAAAEKCTAVVPGGGAFEYDCGTTSAPATQKSDEPWWATAQAQAILAIIGLGGSAAAGAYAFYRVRARRKALTATMLAIERVYQENKAAPDVGIPKLVALRSDIRARHSKGKLDDGNFLELDKRATEHIVRLRFLELDRRFLGLPPQLMIEVRRFVGDGHVSLEDVAMVERHAGVFRVPEPRRAELVGLVQSWSTEDVPAAPEPSVPHKLLVR